MAAINDETEFVAAEPRDEAAARDLLEAARDFDQKAVADCMAKNVIDLFHAIEINRQHGECVAAVAAGFHHLCQRLHERSAVRKIGQAIMIGHMRHARLSLAAFSHVLPRLDKIFGLALIVQHGRATCQEHAQTIECANRLLIDHDAAAPDGVPVVLGNHHRLMRIEDIHRGQADGLFARPLQDIFRSAVQQQISQIGRILDTQRYRNIVDHQFEELLGIFQFARHSDVIGDILKQHDQEYGLAIMVTRQNPVAGQCPNCTIALDRNFVANVTRLGQQNVAVGRIDRRRIGRREYLPGILAKHLVARDLPETLKGTIGEDIATVCKTFGSDTDRHILDHGFEELFRCRELSRQADLFRAVIMRRDSSALGQWPVPNHD